MVECLFGATITTHGISQTTISSILTTILMDSIGDRVGDRVGDIAIHGTTVLIGTDMVQLDMHNHQFTAELTVDDQYQEQI